jgi:16S rRNA processing protein RimM
VTPDWVVLAALRRARGIRGELMAESMGSPPERFTPGLRVFLLSELEMVSELQSADSRPAELERCWIHQGSLVLKFQGIDTRTEAESLQGWFVCIRGEERPPVDEGEVYLSDLVGCEVVAGDGRQVGAITGWLDLGGQVVLEVGKDLLIPYVPEICREVDLPGKRVRVELPEGLEDLNRR